MKKAIVCNDGYPYLALKLALLFKLSKVDHPEFQYDEVAEWHKNILESSTAGFCGI